MSAVQYYCFITADCLVICAVLLKKIIQTICSKSCSSGTLLFVVLLLLLDDLALITLSYIITFCIW